MLLSDTMSEISGLLCVDKLTWFRSSGCIIYKMSFRILSYISLRIRGNWRTRIPDTCFWMCMFFVLLNSHESVESVLMKAESLYGGKDLWRRVGVSILLLLNHLSFYTSVALSVCLCLLPVLLWVLRHISSRIIIIIIIMIYSHQEMHIKSKKHTNIVCWQ